MMTCKPPRHCLNNGDENKNKIHQALKILVPVWGVRLKGYCRVPTRTGKPGKMGRHFPVREKSGNFEQTGKVRENHTKYWKTEIN